MTILFLICKDNDFIDMGIAFCNKLCLKVVFATFYQYQSAFCNKSNGQKKAGDAPMRITRPVK